MLSFIANSVHEIKESPDLKKKKKIHDHHQTNKQKVLKIDNLSVFRQNPREYKLTVTIATTASF